MQHKYSHRTTGEEVKIVGVDLEVPSGSSEWMLTLSNGKRLTLHEFTMQFDPLPDFALRDAAQQPG